MANVGYATLQIIPSAKGFTSRLRTSIGGSLTTEGGKAGEKAGRSFGSSFAKVAVGATAALGAFRLGKGFYDAAIESQKVAKQTEAVFKSMGEAAGGQTVAGIGKMAEKLSLLSGVDDEVVQSAANVLLTFGKVRNEVGKGNKVFDRASAAALDMSVALKQDLQGATIQVGKALNDPIKGITALSRAGVSFTEKQKETIKALVKTGDTLGAQKIILKELENQFGGSAAAQATAGEKLQVVWGNLQEQLGEYLLPVIERVAEWLSIHLPGAIAATETWVKEKLIPVLKDMWHWFEEQILPSLVHLVEYVRDEVIPRLQSLADWISEHESALIGFGVVIGVIALVFGGWAIGILAVSAGLALLYDNVEPFADFVDNMVEGFKRMYASVFAVVEQVRSLLALLNEASAFFGVGPNSFGPRTKRELEERANRETNPSGTLGGLRAMGGSVWAGHTYRINEQGHELFSPGANGTIIPNSALAPADGSAGLSLDIALGVAPGAERDAMSWILKYVRANPGAKRSLAQAVAQ